MIKPNNYNNNPFPPYKYFKYCRDKYNMNKNEARNNNDLIEKYNILYKPKLIIAIKNWNKFFVRRIYDRIYCDEKSSWKKFHKIFLEKNKTKDTLLVDNEVSFNDYNPKVQNDVMKNPEPEHFYNNNCKVLKKKEIKELHSDTSNNKKISSRENKTDDCNSTAE